MKPSRNVFSILLPCLDLAIWLALVIVPGAALYLRLRQELPATGSGTLSFGPFTTVMSRDRLLAFVFAMPGRISYSIAAANLLGVFPEVLVSVIRRTWPSVWRPSGFTVDSWRTLSYPFFCLPFWWFVGCGADALVGRRRLHWSTLLLGSVSFALLVTSVLAFRFTTSASDRADFPNWVLWGVSLWTALFAIFPCVWARQRSCDRRETSVVARP